MKLNKILAVAYFLVGLLLFVFSVPYRLGTGHEVRAILDGILGVALFGFAWVRWTE